MTLIIRQIQENDIFFVQEIAKRSCHQTRNKDNGIGSALLQLGIHMFSEIKSLIVCIEKENTSGMSFYQARGFVKIAEFDDLFDGHLLKMVKLSLKL